MKKSEILFTLSRIFCDALMIFLALVLAYLLRMDWFEYLNLPAPTSLPFAFINFQIFSFKITSVLIFIFAINGRYKFYQDEKIWDEIWNIFWTFSSGMALLLVLFFFIKFYFFSRFIFGMAWGLGILFIFLGRFFLRCIRRIFWKYGYGKVKILILGNGRIARHSIRFLEKNLKFEIVGILTEKKIEQKNFENHPILGVFNDLEKILQEQKINEILLAYENSSEKITPRLVRIAHINHVKFRFLPDELGLDLAAVNISTLGDFPLVTLKNTKMDGWGLVLKNFLDFLLAFCLIFFLLPIFLIIYFLIWIENPKAPIFYKSKRVGKNNKLFNCLKFRTMVPDADQMKKKLLDKNERKDGILFKMQDDPRVTKIGKFLRKWSLDELPQLFNVIFGQMSLIGPRPHLPEEVKKYEKDNLRILSIRPGVTGFSQINGRSSLTFEEEIKFELFYLKNWSLRLDLIIFFKTIFLVLKGENAS